MNCDLVKALFGAMETSAKLSGARIAAHLPALHLLASAYGEQVVELGVSGGNSTLALLSGVLEGNGSLTSYDLDPACFERALFTMGMKRGDPRLAQWNFAAKESRSAAQEWSDGSVSLLFIDTNHTFEHTQGELLAWNRKLRPHGVICGHDYLPNYQWPDRGVNRAVHDFMQKFRGFRLQVLDHDEGLFILWPRIGEESQ